MNNKLMQSTRSYKCQCDQRKTNIENNGHTFDNN